MVIYCVACIALIGVALVAEARHKDGILFLPPAIWYAIIAFMGLWLLFVGE